jgi:iron complex outermembrane receptor protein
VFGQWKGSIDQTVGNYRLWRTVGAVNVPLGSKLAVRVAGVLDQRNSFSRNIGSSTSHPGDINIRGYRVVLAAQPTEAMRVNLRYEDYLNDTDHNAVKNRNDLITRSPFTIEEDAISKFYQKGYRSSAELIFDVTGGVRLRWLSNYQYGYTEDITDGDRTTTALPRPPNANVGRLGYAKTTVKTLAHEFNVLSTSDGPFTWIGGLFYLDESIPLTLLRYNLSTVLRNTAPTSTIITDAKNSSESLFGQVSYALTPQWQVIAGARYSRDKQKYNRITSPGGTGIGVQKSNQSTGRMALNWKPRADLMAYLSYSRGYKGGGVNLGAADPNYLPEVNDVTELGLKTTLLDGHLRINADVFHSDYKNIQLSSLAGVPPAPVTQNAASGVSNGGELELQAVFGGWAINAGIAQLDATFGQDTILQNAVANQNQLVPKGRDLPFSPGTTANAGVQYRWSVAGGTLTPRLQFAHIGTQYATSFPSAVTLVPSRSIVDARLTYATESGWRVEAALTNLGDKVYIASQVQNSSTADGGIIYGAPRQTSLRISKQFN